MTRILIGISILFSSFGLAQTQWSLGDCILYATEHNLTVKQSLISEKVSKNILRDAKNQWMPTLDLVSDNKLQLGKNYKGMNKDYKYFFNSYQDFSSTVSVESSVVLYHGGVVRLNRQKEQLELDKSVLQTDVIVENISLTIVNYYLNVLLKRELKKISDENLKVNEEALEVSRKRMVAGTIARSAVIQAEADVSQAKKEAQDAVIEVDRALFDLAMLLQLPDYRYFDIKETFVSNDILNKIYDLTEVENTAFAFQPIIKKAEVEVAIAKKLTQIERRNYHPLIKANYSLGSSHSDLLNSESLNKLLLESERIRNKPWLTQMDESLTNTFGLSVVFPIFNKNTTRLNIQRSRINEELATSQLNIEKQTLKESIQAAYFDVQSSYNTFEASKTSVRAAEISLDYADRSFKASIISLYDYNVAQKNFFAARSQMLQAKYTYYFRLKVLDYYAGVPLYY